MCVIASDFSGNTDSDDECFEDAHNAFPRSPGLPDSNPQSRQVELVTGLLMEFDPPDKDLEPNKQVQLCDVGVTTNATLPTATEVKNGLVSPLMAPSMTEPLANGGDGPMDPLLPRTEQRNNAPEAVTTTLPQDLDDRWLEEPAPFCRDVWATLFFLLHLGGIVYLAIHRGYWKETSIYDHFDAEDPRHVFLLCCLASLLASVFVAMLLAAFQSCLVTTMRVSALSAVAISLGATVLGIIAGKPLVAVPASGAFVLAVVWTCLTWSRISFCARLVQAAFQALRANWRGLALVVLALIALVVAFVFTWAEAAIGVMAKTVEYQNETVLVVLDITWKAPLLLFSLIWTANVACNLLHTTVVGVVALWLKEEAANGNCCLDLFVCWSLFRSSVRGFGSICLASAMSPLIGLVRFVGSVGCRCGCERIVDNCNKWALVFVGMYGDSYEAAGKKAVGTFEQQGWTLLFQEKVIERFLQLVALMVAVLTGLSGVGIMVMVLPHVEGGVDDMSDLFLPLATLGGCFALVLLQVVDSAADTVTIALAEYPAEVQACRAGLYRELMATIEAYPRKNAHHCRGDTNGDADSVIGMLVPSAEAHNVV